MEEFLKKYWWAISFALLCLIGILWFCQEQYIYTNFSFIDDKQKLDAIKDNRSTFIHIGAGVLALIGIYLTWRRTNALDNLNKINKENYDFLNEKNRQDSKTAENNLILQQFSKAAELLNNDKIEARLSGIYLFEKIMNSYEEYHFPVIEILSAFVRENRKNKEYEVLDMNADPPEGIEYDERTNSQYYTIDDEYKNYVDDDGNKISYCILKYYYRVPIKNDIQ